MLQRLQSQGVALYPYWESNKIQSISHSVSQFSTPTVAEQSKHCKDSHGQAFPYQFPINVLKSLKEVTEFCSS